MNDRIEELIIAYLHRGSTPEQEKELFEACRTNPETASLLRQHLVLSLKLRQLRDSTVVPQEVRNSLLLRINELPPIGEEAPRRVPLRRPGWLLPGRFGLQHLVGAVATTAAIMVAAYQFTPGSGEGQSGTVASAQLQRDTVFVAVRDTVVRTETVRTPVYIVRTVERKNDPGNVAGEPARQPGVDIAQETPESPAEQAAPVSPAGDRGVDVSPAIADNSAQEAPAYLKQYNEMVLSLEKVNLSPSDRIRN